MPELSIAQTSKHYGLNRSTLYAAMADGRLSYNILPSGRRSLNPAEIERAFPPNRPGVSNPGHNPHIQTPEIVTVLTEQNRLLMDTIGRLEEDKRDLRRRLDDAEQERRSMIRLLEDKRPKSVRWCFWRKAA